VSANAVPSARNARTKTSDKAPGARAAKHSKAVVEEPLTAPSGAAPAVALQPIAAIPVVAAHVVPAPVVKTPVVEAPKAASVAASAPKAKTVSFEDIAALAYSYWVERGYQDGNPHEDWTRAEKALLS